ncbi:MAG: redoxin domain-containing protein [Patescibacteria group bacterium]
MTKNHSNFLDIQVLNILDNEIYLRKLQGKYIVLHFFPENDEEDNAALACDLRDYSSDIHKLKVSIVAVSIKSCKLLRMFSSKYNLSFDLWSDEDLKLMKSFGVVSERNWFGNKSIKIKRATFILNPQGEIIKTYKHFSVKGHVERVLEFLKREVL